MQYIAVTEKHRIVVEASSKEEAKKLAEAFALAGKVLSVAPKRKERKDS